MGNYINILIIRLVSFALIICWGEGLLLARAADINGLDRKLEQSVELAQEKTACPIYPFLRAELEKYYARTDFKTPSRQVGWYRAEDFLHWLMMAESELKKSHINTYEEKIPLCSLVDNPSGVNLLGMYLGARYVSARSNITGNFEQLSFVLCEEEGASANFKSRTISVSNNEPLSWARSINLGIHEMSHLFSIFNPQKPQDVLPEIVTFYYQQNYALPVKITEKKAERGGIRFFSAQIKTPLVLKDYNAFLAGSLLLGLGENEILFSALAEQPKREVSILDVLFDLHLLNNQLLTFVENGQSYTPTLEEYLHSVLPPGIPVKKLLPFYQKLSKGLRTMPVPPGSPVQFTLAKEINFAFERDYQKRVDLFAAKHEPELFSLLRATLALSAASQPPAVPPGYM